MGCERQSLFADDVPLYYSTSQLNFELVTRSFIETTRKEGLAVSIEKTKGRVVNDGDVAPVQVEGDEEFEKVKHFTYLGSIMSDNGEVMEDVKSRIAKASRVFNCLKLSIFGKISFSVPIKTAV